MRSQHQVEQELLKAVTHICKRFHLPCCCTKPIRETRTRYPLQCFQVYNLLRKLMNKIKEEKIIRPNIDIEEKKDEMIQITLHLFSFRNEKPGRKTQ